MAQIHVVGRITSDLELKYGQSKNPYVRFNIAEHIGSKDRARVQYYQVWAWNEDAILLVNSNVRKGNLVSISGSLELESYVKQDGFSADKRMKVSLKNWDFVPIGARGSSNPAVTQNPVESLSPPIKGINGDKENLPE